MQILEHGQENTKTLLFLPCTAEPIWAFEGAVGLLREKWHVFQAVYDGHQPEYPGDFTSVEQTVSKITDYLKSRGYPRLDAAYGCSLGGACLTRLLALGAIPIGRAIIDGGITPYQLPLLTRKALLLRDILSFRLVAGNRNILEAAFPPERFTLPGHDPVKEYNAIAAYLKTYSGKTIRNIFWSGNNYSLPQSPAGIDTKITYWYGDDEKKDRKSNIRFIKGYFPQARIHGIPKMAHAELVMIHPEEFIRYADKFLEEGIPSGAGGGGAGAQSQTHYGNRPERRVRQCQQIFRELQKTLRRYPPPSIGPGQRKRQSSHKASEAEKRKGLSQNGKVPK